VVERDDRRHPKGDLLCWRKSNESDEMDHQASRWSNNTSRVCESAEAEGRNTQNQVISRKRSNNNVISVAMSAVAMQSATETYYEREAMICDTNLQGIGIVNQDHGMLLDT
jgi:hypothetical protein